MAASVAKVQGWREKSREQLVRKALMIEDLLRSVRDRRIWGSGHATKAAAAAGSTGAETGTGP